MEENKSIIDFNPKATNKKRLIALLVSVLLVVILAITTALLLKTYVFTTYIVEGISMYPTLDGGSGADTDDDTTNGEVLYLNKIAKIKKGDIVVFKKPGTSDNPRTLVKRVIATAGDKIEIKNNIVYLNGKAIQEDYINEGMNTNDMGEITISENCIFCMGDNRDRSSDSRAFGEIPLENVIGKCFLIKGLDGKLRTCK